MDPRITKSRDRPVRDNPRFSNFAESGSGLFSAQWLITYLIPVRVFLNELVPRSVLDFSKFPGLGPVLDSSIFSVLDQSILVRRYLATPKQWSDYIQSDYIQSDNYKIRTIIEIDYGQWFIEVQVFVVVWLYIVWLNIVWPLFRSVPGLGNPWIYRLDHSCNCKSLYNGNKTQEPNNWIQNRHKSPYEQVWWFSYGQMMLNHNQYI